ncbi:hypothetical protein [uncultured Megasphaera sp.]|uniref:hypothetical protein n=1 Tax=uncultured Megasphaera sp. TaxID=165188 RepID=UPI002595DAE4|nr:hypothetical protein [uncultured Megasphaera sp.]
MDMALSPSSASVSAGIQNTVLRNSLFHHVPPAVRVKKISGNNESMTTTARSGRQSNLLTKTGIS